MGVSPALGAWMCPLYDCVCLLNCRDDFDVMFGEDTTCSVFYLLEMACIEMGVKISYRIRVRGQADRTKLYPHFVYHRMLWRKLTGRESSHDIT